MNTSLHDAVVTIPALRDYLRAFPKATGVSLQVAPTRPGSRRAIVVPVWFEGHAATYLVAHPPARRFSAQRRQATRQLLNEFARHLSALAQHHLSVPSHHAPPCVHRAEEYIGAHLHEPLQIADVARHIGFCSDHFGRVFSRAVKQTFTEYVAQVRVARAQELLAATPQRVSEVAYACGFASIPHFNRVFKRLTGQNPTAYRAAQTLGLGL